MAYQIYFGGDFWYCTSPTSAGQTPLTNPEKWSKINLPNQLRSPIAALAAARIFPQEDNLEQSAAAEMLGRRKLEELLFDSYLAPKAGTSISVVRT